MHLVQLARRAELALRLTETWVRRPPVPTRLVLDVTRRCNLRCAACRTWEAPVAHELSVAEIAAILDQLPRLCWLDVTGGEPFLRPDAGALFDAIADRCRALRVLHFPTNGWFEERVVAACASVRARRPDLDLIVTVSVDGPEDLHDRMRGRVGAYRRAIATLRRLRALPGVQVYVGTTITADNQDQLPALAQALARELPELHPREHHLNWLQVSAHFFRNEGALAPDPPADLVRQHITRRGLPRGLVDLMELVFLINRDFYGRGEPSGVPCQALRSAAFISPEGQLYPCHIYDRPLGDLRRVPFAELWRSEPVLKARDDIDRLACGGCFTPCEAYPALAGAPLRALRQTAARALRLAREALEGPSPSPAASCPADPTDASAPRLSRPPSAAPELA